MFIAIKPRPFGAFFYHYTFVNSLLMYRFKLSFEVLISEIWGLLDHRYS